MVVVPTRTDVTLRFERDGADYLGLTLTAIGILGAVLLRDRRQRAGVQESLETVGPVLVPTSISDAGADETSADETSADGLSADEESQRQPLAT